MHGSEKQDPGYYSTGNTAPALGFGHLGFTVPDVPAALKRLKDNGVQVIKDLGVCDRPSIPISEWENERGVGVEVKGTESEIHPEYAKVFTKIAFVRDPVCLEVFFFLFFFFCFLFPSLALPPVLVVPRHEIKENKSPIG